MVGHSLWKKPIQLNKVRDADLRSRFVLAVLQYLYNARADAHPERLIPIGQKIMKEDSAAMMTVAEQIRAEGMERGMQKGMARGMEKGVFLVAKNLLANGFDDDIVSDNTGLPVETVRKLRQQADS